MPTVHESALVTCLVAKVGALAEAQGACRVVAIQLALGEFTSIMPDHLREHFALAALGTPAAGARLDITPHADPTDPLAYVLTLTGIAVESATPEAVT
jgi:Zn finger protein HypA/HybF involved in hydrogenase expression